MARTAITVTSLAANTGVAEPAGVAVDPTNGHYVDATGLTGQILVMVRNTFAGTKVATIKAGANPPAFRSSIGDAAFTCPASSNSLLGPFESARFVQPPGGTDGGSGGRIFIDLAAAITGTIYAVLIPDTV